MSKEGEIASKLKKISAQSSLIFDYFMQAREFDLLLFEFRRVLALDTPFGVSEAVYSKFFFPLTPHPTFPFSLDNVEAVSCRIDGDGGGEQCDVCHLSDDLVNFYGNHLDRGIRQQTVERIADAILKAELYYK